MYEFHLGTDKAERYVLGLCRRLGIRVNGRAGLRTKIEVPNGSGQFELNLPAEVNFARKNGRADVLQSMHDSGDRFLNTPFSLGTSSAGMQLTISYGAHTSSVGGGGYIEAPEASFSDEIGLYRREAVKAFNSDDLVNFCRCYRAFLQSSVSLVECVLHRYTFHVRQIIPSMDFYQNTATLESRAGLEARLDAWMQTFATHRISDFKHSAARSKFIELKSQRNSIVHPASPTIAYNVKEVVKYMNFAQQGIGGLLSDLREYSGASPHIGFIQHIRTLPLVRM